MGAYPNQRKIIKRAARRHDIKARLLWGLYGAESNFGQNKNTSSAGAQGPFQFMPGTASSYGIDPHNFKQAADAAAKYLSTYKDRGVAGMLAAYNAGPAGDPNNPETAAYIPKVRELAKTWDPPKGGNGGGGGGGRGGGKATRTVRGKSRTVTVPDADARRLALLQYVAESGSDPSSAMMNLASGLRAAVATKTIPGKPRQVPRDQGGKPNRRGGGGKDGGAVSGSPSAVTELFWQGAGGINVKNGQVVPQGFVSGHTDHVHFAAADPKTMLRAARKAQEMGLHVGENDKWDPVDPVHTSGSYHYQNYPGRRLDQAIDVSGDPGRMRAFARWIARSHGLV